MMRWPDLAGLPAVAHATGPFPLEGFLGVWARHRDPSAVAHRVGDGALVTAIDGSGVLRLAGEADLTDYHSPLGSDLAPVAAAIAGTLAPGTRIEFDSLPEEAARPLGAAFAAAGVDLVGRSHDATLVLPLPDDPEAYLSGLDSKQRHEVRRKQRRFAEQAGTATLRRDPAAFDVFAAMHRSAAGEKGTFLTAEMEGFFRDLLTGAGGVIDVLCDGDGTPVGAAFGFEDADTYYLYNSAFDPHRAALSPGIVLVTALITAAIGAGRSRFDFLKGSEEYKLRLGAGPRPLFVLEGVV